MGEALIKIVGLSALQRSVDRRMRELENRRQINAQATAVVDSWIQKNFQSGGVSAMGGKGWKPLQAETIAARRKGGGSRGDAILQDSGNLRKRWKHLWTAALAKVQSGVDYGIFHDKGTKHLPVRRIVPTDKQIWPLIEKLYKGFLNKVLK